MSGWLSEHPSPIEDDHLICVFVFVFLYLCFRNCVLLMVVGVTVKRDSAASQSETLIRVEGKTTHKAESTATLSF